MNIDYRIYFDDVALFGVPEPFMCPQLLEQAQGWLGITN